MSPVALAKNLIHRASSRHDKIFILPTRYGLYFIVIIFTLFLISLSYGHSLAFTTTFVFISLVMTSAHFTNYNLTGVKVIAFYVPENVQEGVNSHFRVSLRNTSNKTRFDIQIGIGKKFISEPITLPKGETGQINIEVKDLTRGEYLLPRLTISSSFPFGLFYAWKYWYEDNIVTVFPALSEIKPSLPLPHPIPNQRGSYRGPEEVGAEEFSGHQSYQEGMPLRAIDWKAYARGKGILLKKFVDESDVFFLFKKDDLLGSEEERISQLASLIDMASAMGLTYALVLDQEKPTFSNGQSFKLGCLKRLALDGVLRKELL
jgi:uncharacterized protein (DUF58 family)